MSVVRTEYFRHLLEDCYTAAKQVNAQPEDEAILVAALVLSDSFNALRKAVIQANGKNAAPTNAGFN